MNDFDNLPALPGTPQEQAWLTERLETLSVREKIILSAEVQQKPPETAGAAVLQILSVPEYTICFPAGNDRQLGEYYLLRKATHAEELIPYIDLEELGRQYRDKHPGCFIGPCYVLDADSTVSLRDETHLPEDEGWSVRLKLASPAVPEGAWLRLPDYSAMFGCHEETALLLNALRVESLEDCTLLEARCILPEAGNLMEQYDSIAELVREGDHLGCVLDELGQGEPHWIEKFTAVLNYEDCRTLKFALDISQNLRCYEWVPSRGLADFAAEHLRSTGVSEELIPLMDLERYADHLLTSCGYILTQDESAYVARNSREFVYEYSVPDNSGMAML